MRDNEYFLINHYFLKKKKSIIRVAFYVIFNELTHVMY